MKNLFLYYIQLLMIGQVLHIRRPFTGDANFLFFFGLRGWQMGFESINQPSQSSEVKRNPKTIISFFWLERGGRWGLSPLTSTANHQKLNVIQK